MPVAAQRCGYKHADKRTITRRLVITKAQRIVKMPPRTNVAQNFKGDPAAGESAFCICRRGRFRVRLVFGHATGHIDKHAD